MTKHLTVDGKYHRDLLFQHWEKHNFNGDRTPHVYERVKDREFSENNFYDCPKCGKYRFRVYLAVYRTPFWDEITLNCKCLNCGFSHKKVGQEDVFDDDFDSIDYIINYFNLGV